MTRGFDHNPSSISLSDAKQISEAIGPGLRESIQPGLDAQTNEIREIVREHENSDNERFSSIEKKISYAGGAAICFLMPLIVELIKHWRGIP